MGRCYEILTWPPAGLDPFRLSVQRQVMRIILVIGIRALLDGGSAATLPASATAPRSLRISRAGSAVRPHSLVR